MVWAAKPPRGTEVSKANRGNSIDQNRKVVVKLRTALAKAPQWSAAWLRGGPACDLRVSEGQESHPLSEGKRRRTHDE